ncbi:unnamed protein product [Moneuplotes crassus]|uniref:Uncharacterized protein n=1 Tax=Euplotes crassus TaxID=5936 RepID=A0AAD1U7T7_EUPCR|nr:unnamed protein product [Moneuplotes crassus]
MATVTQSKIFGNQGLDSSLNITERSFSRRKHEVARYSIGGFEKSKVKVGDLLDEDILIPESWNTKYQSLNFKHRPITEVAGAPTGHENRFEFRKYNPEVINQKTDSEVGDDPPFATLNKLQAYRKDKQKKFAESSIANWQNEHPYFVEVKPTQETPMKKDCRPKTVKQRNEERANYFRVKNGLNKHTQGINYRNSANYGNSISLKYIEKPIIKTNTQLQTRRLSETRKENAKIKTQKKLEDFDRGIIDKENSYFRMNYQPEVRRTRSNLIQNRTNRENEYNQKHFKLKVLGVNGPDIPSFYKTNKEWWKKRKEYVENPRNKSQAQMLQNNKLGSRNEMIVLADFSINEAPQQSFKEHVVMKKKKDGIADKPNANKNIVKTKSRKKHKSNYLRWSEKQGKIISCKGRYFDNLKGQGSFSTDYKPLYSSFNKNGVFVPPPNSKDSLKEQIEEDIINIKTHGQNTTKVTQRKSMNNSKKERQGKGISSENTLFKIFKSTYLGNNKRTSQYEGSNISSTAKPTASTMERGQKRCMSIRSGAFQF